ncbi:hypothetical protein Avbf_00264 [Armadillidium vulgare]|nr:hypothetical protein Avbf_00264 [Armadillidium vulgare]
MVVKTDDIETTNVSNGEREIKTTLEQPSFTLPFEIGNGREDELLNTRGSHLGINCSSKGNTSNRRAPYQNNRNTSTSENPNRSDTNQPLEPNPLPQRNPERRTRTFENSSQQGQTTWNNQGAKPKTSYIEHCHMCGYSHYEGDCAVYLFSLMIKVLHLFYIPACWHIVFLMLYIIPHYLTHL